MKRDLRSPFVQRQFMLEPDFEIYYYKDPSMDSVPDHSHNYYEFYFFLAGHAVLTVNGQEYNIKKGHMAVIPPGVRHQITIVDNDIPYQRFVFWVSKHYARKIMDVSPHCAPAFSTAKSNEPVYLYFFDLFEFNSLQSRLLEIVEEKLMDRYGKDEMIFNQIVGLFLVLSRKIHNMEQNLTELEKPLFANVLDFIDRHLEEDLCLDYIADNFFVSKYHLSHVFKENMGISLYQYILKKRLKGASAAILSTQEITSVYANFGFKDYSSFYRAFKNEYGMSPKQFREEFEKHAPAASESIQTKKAAGL